MTSTLQPPAITKTVTVTYTPPPPAGPKTTIDGDGTYQVGVDIVPGTYRARQQQLLLGPTQQP